MASQTALTAIDLRIQGVFHMKVEYDIQRLKCCSLMSVMSQYVSRGNNLNMFSLHEHCHVSNWSVAPFFGVI